MPPFTAGDDEWFLRRDFHLAVERGDEATVADFLGRHPGSCEWPSCWTGATALSAAAAAGRCSIVRMLLDAGAVIAGTAGSRHAYGALGRAAYHGQGPNAEGPIGNMTLLLVLYLHNNGLTGSIPDSIHDPVDLPL